MKADHPGLAAGLGSKLPHFGSAGPSSKQESAGGTGSFMPAFLEGARASEQGVPFQGGLEGLSWAWGT